MRIYLDGVLATELHRLLPEEKTVWAVADIVTAADGTSTIVPYPSDDLGWTGALATMAECTPPGWSFAP